MAGILTSYWVTKKYPANGKMFSFVIGTSQMNMLNALLFVAEHCEVKTLHIKEHSRTHWEAVEIQGDITYIVEQRDDPPKPDDPMSIQDLRILETHANRKPAPKQLSFL